MNHPKRNSVRPNAEYTPFLTNGLRKTHNSRFSSSVVCLSDIPVETRSGRYVCYGAVFWFATLDSEVWSSCTDKPEWSADVNFHDDIVCVVWHCVKHLVVGKSSFRMMLDGDRVIGLVRTIVDNVVYLAPFAGDDA